MLHHGRLISTATANASSACSATIIGPELDTIKSTAATLSSSSVGPSLNDAKMNTTATSPGKNQIRSRGAYGPDDLEPTFVCLTQFDRPLPSTSVGLPATTSTSASVNASLGVSAVKSRKPRPTSLPADSQPTLIKTLRSKLRPSTSHTSSTSRSTSNPNQAANTLNALAQPHVVHQATTPLPVPSPPSSSSSMARTPTTPHPPDPHTHLSPHTHALLLPSSQTLYGSSSPHPPPKHALQFIRHLVGASRGCADALGMNSSLVLQDPGRNCCGDLGFWVGSVKRGWEGKEGEDEEGEDDEGLSQEMVIERLMLALGLRGWLMVANPMIFPSRLPLRLEELQSVLPPCTSAATRRPIKKFIGLVGKLEDACEVLLGEGERTGGMAPQFLIGKYRWFEDEEEVDPNYLKEGKGTEGVRKGKGKMRTAWCGLVSIRSEMRLEGQKWRPARHFSLEARTPPRSHSPAASHSSDASATGAGADTGLAPRPTHSRTNSRSTSTTKPRSKTHHKRSSSTTLVHALGHTFDHLGTLGHHPLDTSSATLHLGLTAPRKPMTLIPQRFGVGVGVGKGGGEGDRGGLGKLIRMHPYSLILVLVLCLVWEWAWLF